MDRLDQGNDVILHEQLMITGETDDGRVQVSWTPSNHDGRRPTEDLRRHRSVIVVLDGDGTELWSRRIDNDPWSLGLEIGEAGPSPDMVLEATWARNGRRM